MQNQVTEIFNQITLATYIFVYKISKTFWVKCLQKHNALPVSGLVFVEILQNMSVTIPTFRLSCPAGRAGRSQQTSAPEPVKHGLLNKKILRANI